MRLTSSAAETGRAPLALILPPVAGMASLIGRSLALCVHPLAAWRRGSRARVVVVTGYFVASYAMFLLALTL